MPSFNILDRPVGATAPCYIIAEISCNHEGNLSEAKRIIESAAATGCDAVKIQTYTADTISRDFHSKATGTIWDQMDLYQLYQNAHTPWDWHQELQRTAERCGLHLFSSPFDETAVDFLETQNVPAYKVASFEIVDTKLLEKIASTGKPVIMSTGMATREEIDEAVFTLRDHGVTDLALLQCNSGYPGVFSDANLATIPAMAEVYDTVVGLSDHVIFADPTLDQCHQPLAHITPLEGVRFGAKILEVHLTMDRDEARALMNAERGGYDWPFSRTPQELERTVRLIRAYEAGDDTPYETALECEMAALAKGVVNFEPTEKELASRDMRPSLWIVEDIRQGDPLRFAGGKPGNVDSIRPGGGLAIKFADRIDGCRASRDLTAGTALAWDMFEAANNA